MLLNLIFVFFVAFIKVNVQIIVCVQPCYVLLYRIVGNGINDSTNSNSEVNTIGGSSTEGKKVLPTNPSSSRTSSAGSLPHTSGVGGGSFARMNSSAAIKQNSQNGKYTKLYVIP